MTEALIKRGKAGGHTETAFAKGTEFGATINLLYVISKTAPS